MPLAEAREVIELTCNTTDGSDAHKFVNTLYVNALDRLGYDFKLRNVNRVRARAIAFKGDSDGICGATSQYQASLPESKILRVDVVIGKARIELWMRGEDNLDEMLARPDSIIAYSRGDGSAILSLDRFQFNATQSVANEVTGFKMLLAGRVDGFVSINLLSRGVFEVAGLPPSKFQKRVLGSGNIYPYLHQRHKDLIEPLKREIEKELVQIGGPLTE
jgi:hypothetical protein